MPSNRWIAVCIAAITLCAGVAVAQSPLGTAITYQGELAQSGGPAEGTADFRFRLYDAAVGGAAQGGEIVQGGVPISEGRFTAVLDFGPAFGADARWLEIDVRFPAGTGGFVTLSPRQRVTPAPASRYAAVAGSASNAAQFNGQGPAYYQNASNLNAGTLPGGMLSGSYTGAVTFGNSGNAFTGNGAGLTGLNASSLASGTLADGRLSGNVALLNTAQTFTASKAFSGGLATSAFTLSTGASSGHVLTSDAGGAASWQPAPGLVLPYTGSTSYAGQPVFLVNNTTTSGVYTTGIWAQSSGQTNGRGVVGYSTALSGANYGVIGQSDSTGGSGVYGYVPVGVGSSGVLGVSDGTHGTGVRGIANNGTGASGVRGETAQGFGVYGLSTSGGAFVAGVFGGSGGFQGTGVLGEALGGLGWGIYGKTTDGHGVHGAASTASGYGVVGVVNSGTSNSGVRGFSTATNGNGVIAEALSGAAAYGLWGRAPQATGVYCQGGLVVTGTKSFRIDHPADPENRYLIHYCAEGPEPLNIYRGNVETDERGEAVVALPAYFERINRDVCYHLTVVDEGDEFTLAKVSREVRDGAFSIRTSRPKVRVSWQVTGVRDDLYTRRYGAAVEVDKTEKERGTYQHPELYGQAPERGLGHTPADNSGR